MSDPADLTKLNDPDLFRQAGLIDGQWITTGPVIEVVNPATQEVIGTIPDLNAAQTRAAIAAAEVAFASWRHKTPADRAARLERWHDLILAHGEDLARIMTLEQGKPLAEARGEIAYGASFVKWFAEEARRINGSIIPAPANDRRILTLKEPIGVAAIITPWNFPNAMITRKVGPALAAGCTVVIKPSELTPYSALALAVLAERAGIDPGVINVVTGRPAEIGRVLTESPGVRKLSFTGSTRVGSLLMEQSASTVKRLSLELGGNAPFIVFNSADIEAAVEGAMQSKFRNGGQTCVCSNRILVQNGAHDAFVKALSARVETLKVGPGQSPGVEIGPMINAAAIAKIRAHIEDALAKGARIVAEAPTPAGQYAAPVVLSQAHEGMLLAQEETFGPVAPIFRFDTEAEAIQLANDTPFGLAAYFYTRDMQQAWRVGEGLDFGMVGLNVGNVSTTVSPFGGVKQSGIGREGASAGIEEYLETKAFHFGL